MKKVSPCCWEAGQALMIGLYCSLLDRNNFTESQAQPWSLWSHDKVRQSKAT
jgi:hypothetical protein